MQAIRDCWKEKDSYGVRLLVQPEVGSTHAGLWFSRYFKEQEVRGPGSEKGMRTEFSREVVGIQEPKEYKAFFEEQSGALRELVSGEYGVLLLELRIIGRVTTGLGNANPIENGFAFHHTYGVPFLPGSGLKGLAARTARERLGANDEQWKNEFDADKPQMGEFYRMIFGDETEAGGIEIFDALPKPRKNFQKAESGEWKLVADVLTPHHRDYYADGSKPPADWDSPIPIPFLSATGTFQTALYGPKEWLPVACDILLKGLRDEGFGAKTSSGYGRIA